MRPILLTLADGSPLILGSFLAIYPEWIPDDGLGFTGAKINVAPMTAYTVRESVTEIFALLNPTTGALAIG